MRYLDMTFGDSTADFEGIVHQEHHTPSSVPEIPPEAKPSFSKETTEEKDTATTSETTSEKIYERQVQQEAPTISADTSFVTTGIISGETQQSNIEGIQVELAFIS